MEYNYAIIECECSHDQTIYTCRDGEKGIAEEEEEEEENDSCSRGWSGSGPRPHHLPAGFWPINNLPTLCEIRVPAGFRRGYAARLRDDPWSRSYLLLESRDKLLAGRRGGCHRATGNPKQKSSHGIQFMRVWMFLIARC